MAKPPNVFIITWCGDERDLYGSTLVFKTLRVGFPDAKVTVVDNGTPAHIRPAIVQAAEAAGCEVRLEEQALPHWRLLERLCLSADEPCVFVDPDIAFWERVQDWDFGPALLAGRLMPAMYPVGRRVLPRLHTSLLWVPRPRELRARIVEIQAKFPLYGSLFEQKMAPPGRLFWDTASFLYLALDDEEAVAFSDAQLDAYDHIFFGSHLEFLRPLVDEGLLAALTDWHRRARDECPSFRGI